MATVSIDYDSNGDVELIFEKKDNTRLNKVAQQASPSSEQEKPATYKVGPLGVRVEGVRLRVSSLKLISSSPYFQAMLQDSGFRERKELEEHGFVKIELLDPEDEPTAMMIILGILYETDVEVPIELDLPALEKVAVLVDKYQWHALVTPHAISWLDSLFNSQGLPDAFGETLLIWLWIAWLFGEKDHFKALSRVALQDACNSIDLTDESIRLPTRVLKAINEEREVAFQKIEETLEAFKGRLLKVEEETLLPEQKMLKCMAVGFATFVSKDLKLGEFAALDHAKSSIRWLRNCINLSESMQGFTVGSPQGGSRHIIAGGDWDLKSKLQGAISDLKMDEWGLDYDDFKPSLADNQPSRGPDLE